jgi:hypothetical protein
MLENNLSLQIYQDLEKIINRRKEIKERNRRMRRMRRIREEI